MLIRLGKHMIIQNLGKVGLWDLMIFSNGYFLLSDLSLLKEV